MSAYIVTVKPDACPDGVEHCRCVGHSRRAVATPDEMRALIRDHVVSAGVKHGTTADPITDAGGTVGPLPDGTLIEVRPTVSWGGAPIGMVRWLREEQGWSIPAGMDEDAAIAAYNEEQGAAE